MEHDVAKKKDVPPVDDMATMLEAAADEAAERETIPDWEGLAELEAEVKRTGRPKDLKARIEALVPADRPDLVQRYLDEL